MLIRAITRTRTRTRARAPPRVDSARASRAEGRKFIESRRDAAERSEVGAAGHVGVAEEDLASHIADVLMQADAGLTRADANRVVHGDVCPALMARTDISLKQLALGTYWDVSQ